MLEGKIIELLLSIERKFSSVPMIFNFYWKNNVINKVNIYFSRLKDRFERKSILGAEIPKTQLRLW